MSEALNDNKILHPPGRFVKRADVTKYTRGKNLFLAVLNFRDARGKFRDMRVDSLRRPDGAGVVRRLHEAEFGRQNSRFVEAHRTQQLPRNDIAAGIAGDDDAVQVLLVQILLDQ